MNNPRMFLLMILFLAGFLPCSHAQELIISMKDGTEHKEYFEPVQKMTFSDEDLEIVYSSGSIQPYALAGIRKICFYEPTAITELTGVSGNGLSLYPNPVSTRVTIQGIPAGTSRVDLFNLTGMKLLTLPVDENSPVMDVTGLKPGLYVLKASHLTAKFIKQ